MNGGHFLYFSLWLNTIWIQCYEFQQHCCMRWVWKVSHVFRPSSQTMILMMDRYMPKLLLLRKLTFSIFARVAFQSTLKCLCEKVIVWLVRFFCLMNWAIQRFGNLSHKKLLQRQSLNNDSCPFQMVCFRFECETHSCTGFFFYFFSFSIAATVLLYQSSHMRNATVLTLAVRSHVTIRDDITHIHTYIRPFAQLCHSVEFEGCRVLYNWAQWSFFQSWTFQARENVLKRAHLLN